MPKRSADTELTKDNFEASPAEEDVDEVENGGAGDASERPRKRLKIKRKNYSADAGQVPNPFANFSFTAPAATEEKKEVPVVKESSEVSKIEETKEAKVATPQKEDSHKEEEKKEHTPQPEEKKEEKKEEEKKPLFSFPAPTSSVGLFSFPAAKPFAFAPAGTTTPAPVVGGAFNFNFGALPAAPLATAGDEDDGEENPEAEVEVSGSTFKRPEGIAFAHEKQQVRTGEEDEDIVFKTQGKLFVFCTRKKNDKDEKRFWEVGMGELHLNVHKTTKRARLLMRTDKTMKVVLNTPLFEAMKPIVGDDKLVRFMGIVAPGAVHEGLEEGKVASFAFKLKQPDEGQQLADAINKYKEKKA